MSYKNENITHENIWDKGRFSLPYFPSPRSSLSGNRSSLASWKMPQFPYYCVEQEDARSEETAWRRLEWGHKGLFLQRLLSDLQTVYYIWLYQFYVQTNTNKYRLNITTNKHDFCLTRIDLLLIKYVFFYYCH